MNFFIEKLKISNFLSFFGEYEVNLKPFSAVMCNFYEGKDDFFRAFEFVFGARLEDLRVNNPLDLVHNVLREEFLINRDIHAYVEITLNITREEKQLKFSRSIKNGANNPRIEHKISNLITSSVLYEEKLNSLGIFIQKKNLIFYKSHFNNVIWGTPEDLEMTICTCLRENYLLENWRKANKEVQHLAHLKNHMLEKNYNLMKKSHFVLANFLKKYECLSAEKEASGKKIIRDFADTSSNESTPSLKEYTEEDDFTATNVEKIQKKLWLEAKVDFLTEELNDLKLKEAVLTGRLYHEEIKLATKPMNTSILQNRLSYLKSELQTKENQMSEIWENIQSVIKEIENLDEKISLTLISFEEIYHINYNQHRFTSYGRFCDFLQPSRYIQLLKQIVGNDIFYAHLCQSFEEAFLLVQHLKTLKYEHREVFIPFENYSHKLKDLITASGEKGIEINTLEELLIFLCKLNLYHFIDEIPIIVQRQFSYENAVPSDYIIYIEDDIHITVDGLISYKVIENDFYVETGEELKKQLIQLYSEEEAQYLKWKDLLFLKLETLVEMNSLENDVFCFKRKWRKSAQKPLLEGKSPLITEIYEDYSDIFRDFDEEIRKCETELQEEESFFTEGDSSASSNEDSLNLVMKDLGNVVAEKINIKKLLEDKKKEILSFNTETYYVPSFRKNTTTFQSNLDPRKLFFEKEFKKLMKLIKNDDLEDFLGNQMWRKAFITSLTKDLEEIKTKLKASKEKFQNIASARKSRLYKLFDHCNRYLSSTVLQILGDALPFIKLHFGSGEEKIHILSCLGEEKINTADIKHFNTLVKFISSLSVFLEIAKFDKIPVMILDDIEEYFPIPNDDLEAALGEELLEKILPEKNNARFHLLMRLGQFLQLYIKKNAPSSHVRNNGNYQDYINGPTQIIYFVKEDFVIAADHFIWIQNQILPEEYISENCSSYSEIHEINISNMNISN